MREPSSAGIAAAESELAAEPHSLEARLLLFSRIVALHASAHKEAPADDVVPHVLVFIDEIPHAPATNTLGIVFPGDSWYGRVAAAWHSAVLKHPTNVGALLNAARFFWYQDGDAVDHFVAQAQAIDAQDESVCAAAGALHFRNADLRLPGYSYADAARLLDPHVRFPRSPGHAALARYVLGDGRRAEQLARLALELASPPLDTHLGHTAMGLLACDGGTHDAALESLWASTAVSLGHARPSLRLVGRLMRVSSPAVVDEFFGRLHVVADENKELFAGWRDALRRGTEPTMLRPGA